MKKIPDNQFQPGNTFGRGRPQGSRNKATIALQEMLDSHGQLITKKCAFMAVQGDPTALRLCMERLLPPRKDLPVKFKWRPATTAAEVAAAMDAVFHDVAGGRLTPSEGHTIAALLELRRKVIETEEHEARIRALESRTGERRQDEDVIYPLPKAA